MLTNRERLFYSFAAYARLASSSWVNFDNRSTGAFSLVSQFVEERTPRNIVNLFGESHSRQTFDVQFFNRNNIVMVNQPTRDFVLKVRALIQNLLVDDSELGDGLSPSVRPSFATSYTTLGDSHSLGHRLVVPRVLNLRTVRERSKGLDAYIDTNALVGEGQRAFGDAVTGEDCVPLGTFAFDRDFFDCALNLAVLADFYVANIPQPNPSGAPYSKALTIIEKRVVVGTTFKSGESRCLTFTAAPKERLEGFIHLAQDLIAHTRLNIFTIRTQLSYFFNLSTLLCKRDGNTIQFPRISPLLQCRIVKFATQIQTTFESLRLFLVGTNAELVGFAYASGSHFGNASSLLTWLGSAGANTSVRPISILAQARLF